MSAAPPSHKQLPPLPPLYSPKQKNPGGAGGAEQEQTEQGPQLHIRTSSNSIPVSSSTRLPHPIQRPYPPYPLPPSPSTTSPSPTHPPQLRPPPTFAASFVLPSFLFNTVGTILSTSCTTPLLSFRLSLASSPYHFGLWIECLPRDFRVWGGVVDLMMKVQVEEDEEFEQGMRMGVGSSYGSAEFYPKARLPPSTTNFCINISGWAALQMPPPPALPYSPSSLSTPSTGDFPNFNTSNHTVDHQRMQPHQEAVAALQGLSRAHSVQMTPPSENARTASANSGSAGGRRKKYGLRGKGPTSADVQGSNDQQEEHEQSQDGAH